MSAWGPSSLKGCVFNCAAFCMVNLTEGDCPIKVSSGGGGYGQGVSNFSPYWLRFTSFGISVTTSITNHDHLDTRELFGHLTSFRTTAYFLDITLSLPLRKWPKLKKELVKCNMASLYYRCSIGGQCRRITEIKASCTECTVNLQCNLSAA